MESKIAELAGWRRGEVVARVQDWQSRGLKKVHIDVLISCLDRMPVAEFLGLLGSEEERTALVKYLLDHDPTHGSPEVSIEEMWSEEPFPRHLIALLFLGMLDTLGQSWVGVREELWRNLTTTGELYGPALLRDLLKDLFSREELLVRSVDLAASGVDDREFLGTNLFYSMRFSKTEIRSAVDGLLDHEQDKERISRLRAVKKKYG